MSLINKMLQDLDARGGASGTLQEPAIKAVPVAERGHRRWLIAGGAALAGVALALGASLGWQAWQARSAARTVAPAPVMNTPAKPPVPAASASTAAPAQATAPAPAPAPVIAAAPAPAPVTPSTPQATLAVGGGAHGGAPSTAPAAKPARAGEKPHAAAQRGQHSQGGEHAGPAQDSARAASAKAAAAGGAIVHEQNPVQLSENTYRRALIHLQEGRVAEALADLQRALESNPRNDAARQTLISLLIESKRTDEAMRELGLALNIDPRQPGLAMVLARLQLERNGPALETLERSLPYAENSADYQSLLAGVLQRQQRHAEAIVHYNAALKLQPQNAVWWMGLGISLQADNHPAEARVAFNRARSLPGLSPELQAFVERKLEVLAR